MTAHRFGGFPSRGDPRSTAGVQIGKRGLICGGIQKADGREEPDR